MRRVRLGLFFGALLLSMAPEASIAQEVVLDVNGDGVVGPEESLAVAEQWKQAAKAANDHNHLGQTWVGANNPLDIFGQFDSSVGAYALSVTNTHGNAILAAAAAAGIWIQTAGTQGVLVSSSAGTGMTVVESAGNGVSVQSAGANGVTATSINPTTFGGRFINAAPGGSGLYAQSGDDAAPDIILGRNDDTQDRGVISSSPEDLDSKIFLRTYDLIAIHLDDDNNLNRNAVFRILNGSDDIVFEVDEFGKANADGEVSAAALISKADHPLEPGKKSLQHAALTAPERLNVYSGNVVLNENGEAWVELPEYFEAYNEDFRYQLTPVGGPAPNLHVAEKVRENRFKIAGGAPGLEVSWNVTGARRDAYAKAHPFAAEQEESGE